MEATITKKKAPDLPASIESDTAGTAELIAKASPSPAKPSEKSNPVAAVATTTVESAIAAGVVASTRLNGREGAAAGEGGRSSSSLPPMRAVAVLATSSSQKVHSQAV